MTALSENMRKIRKNKGLTQKQVGENCGLKESTIRQYELGYRNPKLETIKKIASGLGVDYKELLEGTELHRAPTKLPNLIDAIGKRADITINGVEIAPDPGAVNELIIKDLFRKLNDTGQNKAIEQVELLTKIPEYRNQD